VAVSSNKPLTNKKNNSGNDEKENIMPRIRYVDWPGHAPLNDAVLEKSVWNKASTTAITGSNNNNDAPLLRIVLVLDATQPVAAAAETLYELWSRAAQQAETKKTQRQSSISIFCACHKKDLQKAKNSKRIKIQMRTELQRLLAVQKPSWWTTTENNNADHSALELNALPYCKLHFASTSSSSMTTSSQQEQQQQPGMDELATFCQTGQLPES
jgi:hypothetical protein